MFWLARLGGTTWHCVLKDVAERRMSGDIAVGESSCLAEKAQAVPIYSLQFLT